MVHSIPPDIVVALSTDISGAQLEPLFTGCMNGSEFQDILHFANSVTVNGPINVLPRRGSVITPNEGTSFVMEQFLQSHPGGINVLCEWNPETGLMEDGQSTEGPVPIDLNYHIIS